MFIDEGRAGFLVAAVVFGRVLRTKPAEGDIFARKRGFLSPSARVVSPGWPDSRPHYAVPRAGDVCAVT
ncbi:MAG: hypothetical protein Q4C87_09965 [Actinomycetaceae bacterium]|nr:hypothetical protein [Actinomycetaceae bacterium]